MTRPGSTSGIPAAPPDASAGGGVAAPAERREGLREVRRLVVKVGTRVLAGGDRRFDRGRLDAIVEQVAPLVAGGREVLLVSSGAVGLGAELLGLERPPERLEDRQACAAVGQASLIQLYRESLSRYGLLCAQLLLTEADFVERQRYLNLRATLHNLVRRGVLPVINENDTVSVDELVLKADAGSRPVFGDNDRLSALVATKLDAQLLVIVTDVGGVYDRDPKADPEARLVERVDDLGQLDRLAVEAPAAEAWGRGGIRTKVEAAQVASRSGCAAIIASAGGPDQLTRILDGEPIGTWFPPRHALDAYRRWLAFAARASAVLVLDDGAVEALRFGKRSLLAAGVRRIEGDFEAGDVVELETAEGRSVGRGIATCDAEAARRRGAESQLDPARAGRRSEPPLVRRERMVLEEWAAGEGSATPPSHSDRPERSEPAGPGGDGG